MKKVILSALLLCVGYTLKAQNTFPTTGNVGIGTSSPDTPIEISKASINAHTDFLKLTMPSWSASINKNKSIVWDGGANTITAGIGASYDGVMVNMDFHSFYNAGEKTDSDVIMRIKGNGNVGIGTTNPAAKFQINKANLRSDTPGNSQLIRLGDEVATSMFGLRISATGSQDLSFDRHYGGSWSQAMMIQRSSGNVGVGTTTPISKLDINGVLTFNGNAENQVYESPQSIVNSKLTNTTIVKGRQIDLFAYDDVVLRAGSTDNIRFNTGYGETAKMIINNLGNVGIGTTTPDAKLAVNGKIHTKEVKVDLVGWPDFVFKEAYQLPTLEEVEKHINEKGHLKDIPSEKEVLKNGIHLGEMNAKLLQKIEELTLYTIAQEKKLNEKDKELKALSERMAIIEKYLKNK